MKKKLRFNYHVIFFSLVFILSQQSIADTIKSDKKNKKTSDNIAVATVNKSENSKISDKAGRAAYFLIFDSNGKFMKSIKNPAQGKKGGASSSVIRLLKKESVKIFIANKFGDKMINNLKAAKIEYQNQTGVAKEVIENFLNNERSKNDKK